MAQNQMNNFKECATPLANRKQQPHLVPKPSIHPFCALIPFVCAFFSHNKINRMQISFIYNTIKLKEAPERIQSHLQIKTISSNIPNPHIVANLNALISLDVWTHS